MRKAWSKATPAQREKHRQRCIEVGKQKQAINLVGKIFDYSKKLKIDGGDFLTVFSLMIENKKNLETDNGQQIISLLKKKMKPERVYRLVFES